jgi:ketosteroid isomerase-like protein
MEGWDEDIEWEGPNADELPGSGTRRGKQDVAEVLNDIMSRWENPTVSPDEFVEGEDTVVVLGHFEGRAKETGQEVKTPFAHVWRFSGGKAKRLQVLTDTVVQGRALGVL